MIEKVQLVNSTETHRSATFVYVIPQDEIQTGSVSTSDDEEQSDSSAQEDLTSST